MTSTNYQTLTHYFDSVNGILPIPTKEELPQLRTVFYQYAIENSEKPCAGLKDKNSVTTNGEKIAEFCQEFLKIAEPVKSKFNALSYGDTFSYDPKTLALSSGAKAVKKEFIQKNVAEYKKNVMEHFCKTITLEASYTEEGRALQKFLVYKTSRGWFSFIFFLQKLHRKEFLSSEKKLKVREDIPGRIQYLKQCLEGLKKFTLLEKPSQEALTALDSIVTTNRPNVQKTLDKVKPILEQLSAGKYPNKEDLRTLFSFKPANYAYANEGNVEITFKKLESYLNKIYGQHLRNDYNNSQTEKYEKELAVISTEIEVSKETFKSPPLYLENERNISDKFEEELGKITPKIDVSAETFDRAYDKPLFPLMNALSAKISSIFSAIFNPIKESLVAKKVASWFAQLPSLTPIFQPTTYSSLLTRGRAFLIG